MVLGADGSVTLCEVRMMNIKLGNRTAETVAVYFEKANRVEIRASLPQKAKTLKEALEDYEKTLLPGATSYGRIVLADDKYIGDIWCYAMNPAGIPNAMLSFCIFESSAWNKGIATEALRLFMAEIQKKFSFNSLGAFTFSSNLASIRVLQKNGFHLMEEFEEDGAVSKYFQYQLMDSVRATESGSEGLTLF